MSHFQKKLTQIKQTIRQNQSQKGQIYQHNINHQNYLHKSCQKNHHCQSAIEFKIPTKQAYKQHLCNQQPIIIQKKNQKISNRSYQNQNGTTNNQDFIKSKTFTSSVTIKKVTKSKQNVQPFIPVQIKQRDKNTNLTQIETNIGSHQSNGNKEILIQIEKDQNKNKQCLKKLFKKIHKLTEDLANSQKQKMRLQFQLQNYQKVSKICFQHQKIINKLEGQNYKLKVELDLLKKQLIAKDKQIEVIRIEVNRKPKQIIKEIVIQKPIEIQVEVPKMIPGPQRIVQKVVEVPKYIEVQKPVTVEVIKQIPRDITKTVQVPTIVQKPIYIDKPVYLDRPIQIQRRIEVPIQVPIQVPVYIDRPMIQQQSLKRIQYLQGQIQTLLRQNSRLQGQSYQLRLTIQRLDANLTILRQHNQQKNRQVQILLHNSIDYQPISPSEQRSFGSIKYTVSSNPHKRVI